MVAITVKFNGPTNSRGSRYIAVAPANNKRVSLSADDGLSPEQNRDKAALELCKKMNWIGDLIRGELEDRTVYVFYSEGERVRNPEVDGVNSTQAEKEYNENLLKSS